MRFALTALLLLLAPLLAQAAAPDPAVNRPLVTAFVRPWAVVGAPIRVELMANCTARMPDHPEQQFHVFAPGGAEVAGSWAQVPRTSHPGFVERRVDFTPAQPLAPGIYTLRGMRLTEGFEDVEKVEVRASAGDPPLYLGPLGVACSVQTDPNACHQAATAAFRLNPGESLQNVIWIVRLRQPGQPYLDGNVWIGTTLPEEFPPGTPLAPGHYIAALDQRDEAGQEGHYLCEVGVDLPAGTCGQFPAGPLGAQGPSLLIPAQCPKLQQDGSVVSAIDGFKFSFPPAATAPQLKKAPHKPRTQP